MNQNYIDTVRLLLAIAPAVLASGRFAMKGGTALNLFVQEMPRLSVDIDLVFVDHRPDRQAALHDIAMELAAVQATLTRQGYRAHLHATAQGDDVKLVVSNGATQVKVEVNVVFRGTALPVEHHSLVDSAQNLSTTDLAVPVLATAELYGSKLVAAMDRQHPRDIFDVMHMLQRFGWQPEFIDCFVVDSRETPAWSGGCRPSVPTALAARQVDTELLELAIKVGALQAGFFGHAGHAAAFLRKVKLEIAFLERIARHAQRAVEVEALFGLRAVCLPFRRLGRRCRAKVVFVVHIGILAGGVICLRPGCLVADHQGVDRNARGRTGQPLGHRTEQLLKRDRLFKKRHGSTLGGLDRRVYGAVATHHDHRHGEHSGGAPLLEQGDAIDVGHPDVEQHQVRTSPVSSSARLGRVFSHIDGVTFVGQYFGQESSNAELIVNNKNGSHGPSVRGRGVGGRCHSVRRGQRKLGK